MKRIIKSWKGWVLVLVLAGLSLAALAHGDKEPSFAVPQGVTLQAKPGGRYLLYWEPIDADNLMGYSIWLRRQGEKEFVRLSVPVKVGKEIQKQPMVSASKLELKLGEGRKDLEFAVVAEYEDGPSLRSPSVFSATALRSAPAVPVEDDASGITPTADAGSDSPTAAVLKPNPYADEDKPAPAGEAPWDQGSRATRPLLTPPHKLRSTLSISYEMIRSIYSGTDVFANLGLIGTDIPYSKVVNWQRIDLHTRFTVPLKAEYGLLPGVELWAQAQYEADDVTVNTYNIDGENFDYIRPVRVNPDGSLFFYPDPSSVAAGDSQVGARVQPLPSEPLVLLLQAIIPTGISHFKSYLDYSDGRAFAAGTGDGVLRLGGGLTWGWRGLRPGPSFRLFYSPGVTEHEVDQDQFGAEDEVVRWGDKTEGSVEYTIPWRVEGRDGAVIVGALGRSIGATHWTQNGIDLAPYFDKIDSSRLAAYTGIKFNEENQLELSVDVVQDLIGGFETGGRLAYTSGLFGDELSISGRLVY